VTFPTPEPGLVIRYSYLWYAEHREGREEGVKDRPCAVVLTTQNSDGDTVVTVLHVTHALPTQPAFALEIPSITKRRLGLDSQRAWVVFNEANRFVWPGPDLRILPGQDAATAAYGVLPPNFFSVLRDRYLAAIKAHRSEIVRRSD